MLEFPEFQVYNKKTKQTEKVISINYETKSFTTQVEIAGSLQPRCYLFNNEDLELYKIEQN